MNKINNADLVKTLNNLVLDKQIIVLGICVGMQIFANRSDEGVLKGFGWIKGSVRKILKNENKKKLLLPHMGE